MAQLMFASLPSAQSRWKWFLTGWSTQALLLAALLSVNALFPKAIPQARRMVVTSLVAYEAPVPHEPQPINPRLVSKPAKLPRVEAPVVAKLVLPPIVHKRPEAEVKTPELKLTSKMPDIPLAPVPKVIATNTFSTGSSAMPTTNKPAAAVQTGGFGDPNGIPAGPHHGPIEINASGSFNLPTGSGHGNGLGGSSPGVVASAGFGNGVAVGSPKGGSLIQSSGFDSHHSTPEPQKVAAVSGPPTIPVEILFKPKPDYTDAGRQLRIDGEVRLEVLFSTNGQVHVIKVLQGLGYGLDEQAVKAAEKIKFKPALHEGQPVDSTAVVHIIFELAS